MGKAVRLLVVEDEPDQRRLVAGILEAEGYQIHQAGTLSEARDALENQSLDVILSDWQLPDGTGLELLEGLRQRGDRERGANRVRHGDRLRNDRTGG